MSFTFSDHFGPPLWVLDPPTTQLFVTNNLMFWDVWSEADWFNSFLSKELPLCNHFICCSDISIYYNIVDHVREHRPLQMLSGLKEDAVDGHCDDSAALAVPISSLRVSFMWAWFAWGGPGKSHLQYKWPVAVWGTTQWPRLLNHRGNAAVLWTSRRKGQTRSFPWDPDGFLTSTGPF